MSQDFLATTPPAVPTEVAPAPPPAVAVPVMEYDTPPRADQVPRRRFHLALLLALVLGALAGGLLVLVLRMARTASVVTVATRTAPLPPPPRVTPSAVARDVDAVRRESNEARLQKLVSLRLPPTQVVYEEDPVAARKLYGKGVCDTQATRRNMSQPYFGAFEPPVYQTDGFWRQNPLDQRDALLFSGQLKTPGGNSRLVLFEMEVTLEGTKLASDEYKVAIHRQLKYRIGEPRLSVDGPETTRWGTSLKIVQAGEGNVIPIQWVDGTLRSARPAKDNLRFFAGQPDPKDTSHFTVVYELGGVKKTIDCYLTDDDFLRVIPRGGAVDKGEWRIDAGQ